VSTSLSATVPQPLTQETELYILNLRIELS